MWVKPSKIMIEWNGRNLHLNSMRSTLAAISLCCFVNPSGKVVIRETLLPIRVEVLSLEDYLPFFEIQCQ